MYIKCSVSDFSGIYVHIEQSDCFQDEGPVLVLGPWSLDLLGPSTAEGATHGLHMLIQG